MNGCRLIYPLVTTFVDGEGSAEERALVSAHLQECTACRERIAAESATRQLLRTHAAVARAMSVSSEWRPNVWRLGRPWLPVRPRTLVLGLAIGACSVGVWNRPLEAAVVGVISDSFCRLDHHRIASRVSATAHSCTLGCVERGATLVLISEGRVYQIRNQDFPTLKTFAAKRVKVSGTLRGEAITIASLAPADL